VKAFHELASVANKYMEDGKSRDVLEKTLSLYTEISGVFGLFSKVKDEKIPENVKNLADEREIARKSGDWKKSDDLRNKIKQLGYIVEDSKDGQKIKKAQ